MPTPDIWSALAHPARRRILDRLRDGPALTGELAALLNQHDESSRFTALRHLKTLKDAGLVLTEETGRERLNRLNGTALYQATIGWLDPPSRAMAGRLDRLKTSVDARTGPTTEPPKENRTMTDFHSFDIAQQIDIDAPPERVWTALVTDTSAWWGAPYLLIDRPGSEIRIETTIGAPVVESNDGEQQVWGTVSSLKIGEVLGWTGPMGMGPLAWGTVEFRLSAVAGGTRVDLTQASFGAFGAGAGETYQHGWGDLMHRLRAHLVDGVDYGVGGLNLTPEGLGDAT